MKIKLLLFLFVILFHFEINGQCTISGSPNVNSNTITCSTFSSCTTIYVGDGTNQTNLVMNSNLNLTCYGVIQFVVRNNANIDFSNGNYDLSLAANSSIVVEAGGNISAGSNCSNSDLIKIGGVSVSSCQGAGGLISFPNLVLNGGYNTVIASATSICGSGTSTITASKNPVPTSATTYNFYTVASGGTAVFTSNVTSSPYIATYTTPTLTTNTTYYVSATTNSNGSTTPRRAVEITVNPSPTTPTVTTTQPTCTTATGTITITAPTGIDMTYSINGVTYTNTTGIFTSVAAGTYNVTAKNSSGCISSAASVTVISSTNTWNGSVWLKGAPPTSSERIVFAGTYTSATDLIGCACQVNSGIVTISSGNTLTITNEVTVSGGSLIFQDTASLVQTNDASVNSGNITYRRKTTPLKQYDYTYWSSPVTNATLSQLATNSLFYSFSPTINNWVYQIGSTTMTPEVGFIGRAPSGLTYSPTQIVETSFVGVPNNGIITTPILKSVGTYNLIGNPYPSAIDIDLFLTDAANTPNVNGTIYLWTHNTAITNNNYTVNDYAKYNLSGGTATAPSGGPMPTGKIAACQGFFIEANTLRVNGVYSATFRNSMRLTGNNNQFFRANSPTINSGSVSGGLERHRVWLSLTNSLGAYNQMLVGYIEGATNDFDTMFDGKILPVGNTVAIYTKVADYDLSIQGKSLPFSSQDIVPVAYSTTTNGEVTITLDNFDGLFETQNIYLFDKTTGIYHDLKAVNYTFTTASGTFNDRFELRFVNGTLGNENPILTNENIKVVTNNQLLTVYSSAAAITKVQVFDVLGKLLFSQNDLNTNIFETKQLQNSSQLLLVKVTLDNGQTYTKKTLIH